MRVSQGSFTGLFYRSVLAGIPEVFETQKLFPHQEPQTGHHDHERERERQRQTDTQTDRQTDTQTDRQTDTQTDRQTDRH